MNRMGRLFVWTVLLAVSTTGWSQDKISPALMAEMDAAMSSGAAVKALVMVEDGVDIQALDAELYARDVSLNDRARTVITTLKSRHRASQAPLLSFLRGKPSTDVVDVQPFWISNLIAVEVQPHVVFEMADRADVRYLHLDAELQLDRPVEEGPAAVVPNGVEPGLRAINAHLMWEAGYTGRGVIVMGIDTGVDGNHPALAHKWVGLRTSNTQGWLDPSSGSSFPNDGDSHGTHTMGTMCGLDTVSRDTVGVAFNAEWMASNSLMGGGSHTSRSIASFQWAMDPDGDPNTHLDMPASICNSWWDPSISVQCNPAVNPYINVITAVEAAGIAVIFSAGNSGPGASTVTAPKNVNTTVVQFWATGALNGSDPSYPIASFSSRGPVVSECLTGIPSLDIKPEASAPGVSVRSSEPGNSYGTKSGTSMAAPHVAGAIALLREAFPDLTGTELKLALYQTARDLGTPGEDNTYGMGIIDVWAAFMSLGVPERPANLTAYSDYTMSDAMELSWENPTFLLNGDTLMPDQHSVLLQRGDQVLDTLDGTVDSYLDTGLTDGDAYTYQLWVELDSTGLASSPATATWIAGGAPTPAPVSDFTLGGNENQVRIYWRNPAVNVDDTPLDDLAGINLYRDGALAATFTRTSADSGVADSAVYDLPTPGLSSWYITAVDNQTPANESEPSPVLDTPLSLPLAETFDVDGEPNPAVWINRHATVDSRADTPPSPPFALNLNGTPTGGDTLDLKPIDLSGMDGMGLQFTYAYQPEGTGNSPETNDSLSVYFKNDMGEWILVRAYEGTDVVPFQGEVISLDQESAGMGTFFHPQFQVRFRSQGGRSNIPNDEWFVDDIALSPATGIGDEPVALPEQFAVAQNYPNPFNPTTTIHYSLPERSEVTLTLYNTLGQTVRTLVKSPREAGSHRVMWDGRDDLGRPVASGIYLYRFTAGDFVQVRKMILLK